MTHLDNPAGRLRYWIDQADQEPKKDVAMAGWCRVFGVDPDTPAGRARALGRGASLMELAHHVRAEAEQLPATLHPELLLVDFHQVESMLDKFTVLHQVHMQDFLSPLQATGRRGLELLDTYLHTNRPERWIESDQRESLLEQVRKLIDEVIQDDDVEQDLRQFVLTRLRDVENALLDAKMTGTSDIARATDALLGAMHRRPDMWDRIAQAKWATRLGKVTGALCLALGSVGGIPALMPASEAINVEIEQDVNIRNTDTNVVVIDRNATLDNDNTDDGVVDAEIL